MQASWALQRAPAVEPGTEAPAAPGGEWIEIPGASTVAAALRALGRWSLDAPAQRFDADDWWFRARFDAPPSRATDARRSLVFGGLAGHCEAWLNGAALLTSDNMHLAHRCPEPALDATGNELLLRFASLDAWLARKRPRPRWRAPMVEHQQLRFSRNTLLGRTPGWSPPAAPVGPWRAIEWVDACAVEVADLRVTSRVDGTCGRLDVSARLVPIGARGRVARAQLELSRDGAVHRVDAQRAAHGADAFAASLDVNDAALWWPHTHGEPALYDARLRVDCDDADAPVVVDLGRIGFRTLALDSADGRFAISVNGVPVFCRGACWTPLDPVALNAPAEATRAALEQVRDAGMNMLRVSGSMVYEDDHFHDACDALGLLVWQDFMFANMDYPAADPAFAASVRDEVAQQLARGQARPSLAVLCGNSEAEQQAAMWGSPREHWSQPLFARDIAELAAAACPGVPYWPSSAHGGAFPHQNDAGTTSYYGVGAYRRGLDDARRSGLRFATECLAFANVPPASTIARMPGGHALRVHHPTWKARAPRDLGAGWDFEDVRDHYLRLLYGVDPVALRSADHDRYLALSRAVPGEVMGAAFAEWRRGASSCGGALVWFLRDLWPGAGWGLLDDRGGPKAAFHALRRAFAPIALFLGDEGTNGLEVTIVNEPERALEARVEIALYRDDGLAMQRVEQAHTIAARGTLTLPAAGWFDAFVDLTNAYRFGPAEHALVVATLRDAHSGAELAQAFHFPQGLPSRSEHGIGLSAQAHWRDDGQAELHLRTQRFAQSIEIDVAGFAASAAHFHLAPGAERCVRLVPLQPGSAPALAGHVQALNDRTRVVVEAA